MTQQEEIAKLPIISEKQYIGSGEFKIYTVPYKEDETLRYDKETGIVYILSPTLKMYFSAGRNRNKI